MSVQAVSWSLRQGILRSANKFILLVLAHQVPPHQDTWETYASISFLVAATSLNRKTVVSAIDALRTQGILKVTGKKAGSNKQIPVYEIDYRTAWPEIDIKQTIAWVEQATKSFGKAHLESIAEALEAHEALRNDERAESPAPIEPEPATQIDPATALAVARAALRRSHQDKEAMRLMPLAPRPGAVAGLPKARSSQPTKASLALVTQQSPLALAARQPLPAIAPAVLEVPTQPCPWNGSQLPETWALPEHWREWALQRRPGWDLAKVTRVASVFHTYCRGQPDARSRHDDWEARWRLWVLRENDALVHAARRADDDRWWRSEATMQAKASRLGIHGALPGERLEHFRDRIQRHLDREELPLSVEEAPVDNSAREWRVIAPMERFGALIGPKTVPVPGPKTDHNRY